MHAIHPAIPRQVATPDTALRIMATLPAAGSAIVTIGELIFIIHAFATKSGHVELWKSNAIRDYLFKVTPKE